LEIEVIIPGQPMSQKRHRPSFRGGNYDPSSEDKKRIQNCFLHVKPTKPTTELLRMDIFAFFETPTSWSEKKRQQYEGLYRGKTPDCDNIQKIVMDALNKFLYVDDKQIVSSHTEKFYSVMPCTVIRIKTINQKLL
jgi:Holliday junction resolvase RusA-like endonuclease